MLPEFWEWQYSLNFYLAALVSIGTFAHRSFIPMMIMHIVCIWKSNVSVYFFLSSLSKKTREEKVTIAAVVLYR